MNPSPPKLKVLVADDSPVYRKLVEQSLVHDHYAVLLAKNGQQAMDLFAQTPACPSDNRLDYA